MRWAWVPTAAMVEVWCPLGEELGEAMHHGQRRAQLVGDGGQELVLQAVQLAQAASAARARQGPLKAGAPPTAGPLQGVPCGRRRAPAAPGRLHGGARAGRS